MRHSLRRLVDAKSSAMAIVQTAVANVGVQAANILCGIVTARSLGPAGRGALAAVIMWPQFLAYALTFGVPVATVYWVKRRPEEEGAFTGAALLLCLLSGLLGCVVGIITIPYSLHVYSHQTIRFAQEAVLVCPLALSAVTLTALVQCAGNFKIYNLFRFLSPVSVLAVLCLEKLTGTLTVMTAGLAYLLAATPATIWIVRWVWKEFRPSFKGLQSVSQALLSYGVRAWGADLFSTVANQVDRVLVLGMLNPEAMGLYVVSQSAAGVLTVLPRAVVPVTLPKSSGMAKTDILTLTGKAVRMTLLVMLVASLPLFFCGGLLLKLVYGSKFLGASMVLPFLVVETILDGLTSVLAQAFLAAGVPGTLTFLEGCGLLTSIPLLYWLIPIFGLRGAGCALMLGTSVRFLLVLLNFPFRLQVRPPNVLFGRAEISELIRRFARRRSVTNAEPAVTAE